MDPGFDKVKKHKLDILIVLALFLVGFGIRLIPGETFPGIYGFDPYNHARIIKSILQTGDAPRIDPLAYWPEGRTFKYFSTMFHVYTAAAWYRIFSFISTGSYAYNQQFFYANFYPLVGPFYGALAIVAIYLLGLVIRNRKAGFLGALAFMAGTSTLYRTMFGFSEEDPLGFFIYGISLALVGYAFKKRSIKWGWIAGLALGIYAISWRTVVIPMAVIAVFLLAEILRKAWKKEYDELEKDVEIILAMLVPMASMPLMFEDFATGKAQLPILGVLFIFSVAIIGVLLNYWLKYRKLEASEKASKKAKIYKYTSIAIVILAAIIFAWKWNLIINKVQWLVFQAPYNRSKLMKTVGEEHPGSFAGVINALGILSLPFLLGLVWLPIRRFIRREKYTLDLLIWLMALVTFYLFINKLKMGYVFDEPAAALIGVVLADFVGIADWMKKHAKNLDTRPIKAILLGIALIFALFPLGKGIVSMEYYKPSYSPQSGWIAGLDHFASMPDKDKYVFLVWWDYGDWISWRDMKVTLDGVNSNATKVMMTARVLSDFRGNNTDEILEKHTKELKMWGVNHIGIDRILVTCQKWGAVTFLGDNECIPKEDLEKWGIKYPGILANPQQGCPPGTVYSGCMQMVRCYQGADMNGNPQVVCPLGKVNLVFTPEEWQRMVNTPWPGYNLETTVGNQVLKARVYARPDGYLMFFVDRYGRILPDAPSNYMLGYRLFFRDPSITDATLAGDFYGNLVTKYHYPERYRYVPSEEVVFWALDWDKLNNTVS